MLTAIIVAAGSSQRMGFDKLMAPIAGKPVIEHTIDAFAAADSVTQILVVTRPDKVDAMKKLTEKKAKMAAVIPGGERRQDSVAAGLLQVAADTRYVAVHDAARPMITSAAIERVFAKAQEHGAASAAEAVSDTLKRADTELFVQESVDRHHLFAMQTPQIFARALLEEAYRAVFARNFHITDEVSAVQYLKHKVMLVPGEDPNFKITYERDLRLADFLLRERRVP